MKILKSILTFSSTTFISRIFGLIRDICIARTMGAGLYSDVFLISFKIPNLFRRVFAEGSMNSAFVPIYKRLLHRKQTLRANVFAGQVFILFFAIIFVLCTLFYIFMPEILKLILPGFYKDPYKFGLIVETSKILIWYLLFVFIAAYFSAAINAKNNFFYSGFFPVILNLSLIFSLLLSAFNFTEIAPLKLISYGVIVGGVLQSLFVFYGTYRQKAVPLFVRVLPMTRETIEFFKKASLVFFSAGFYQINMFADTLVMSFLPSGSVSYLFYADRINQLPLAVIGISLGIVYLSEFSDNSKTNKQKMDSRVNGILLAFALSLPACIGLVSIGDQIIYLLFQSAKFTTQDALRTSNALAIYALSLPFALVCKVLLSIFYSMLDTKTPFVISAFSTVFNIALLFPFVKMFGFLGIPLAFLASNILNFSAMFIYLVVKKQLSINNVYFYKNIACFVFVAILVFFYLSVFKDFFFSIVDISSKKTMLIFVLTSVLTTAFIWALLSYLSSKKLINQIMGKLK